MKKIHGWVTAAEPWSILLVAGALVLSVVQMHVELEDRTDSRIVRAWQLINTIKPGNSGKISALEYLNKKEGLFCWRWAIGGCIVVLKRQTKLTGIDLSVSIKGSGGSDGRTSRDLNVDHGGAVPMGVYLQGVKLTKASLENARLQNADLQNAELRLANLNNAKLQKTMLFLANLARATLIGAKLQEAILVGANLSSALLSDANLKSVNLVEANLRGAVAQRANLESAQLQNADLRGADLRYANLENADLWRADLRGTDLRFAGSLMQGQISQACGDHQTQLDEGLVVRVCN